MRSTLLIPLCCAASITLVAGTAAAEDAYDDAFARAYALEVAGNLDEAARALELVLPLYPQDLALPLQIAWIHFRAGRYGVAEGYYRMALDRSPSAPEARLGLAASLERQGRCAEAHPVYEALAAERPDLTEARAGAERCTVAPAWRATLSLSLSGVYSPDLAYKSLTGGGALGVTFAHRSGFFLGATYRYLRFAPPSGAAIDAWDQHEAYASIGYSGRLWGLAAHYAFLHDGSGALGDSHHVGMIARVSPFGDIEVSASASFYDDGKVFRVEPSWRVPIAFGLSLRPAIAVQYAAGEVLTTGSATLALDRSRFSLWAGAKVGDEARPVYFAIPLVEDVSEKIALGAWAGAAVNVNDDVRIHLSYAMDRLKQATGTATNAHALTLGIAVSF